jgi:hypothetical protein
VDWDDRHHALEGAAMLVNTTSQGMLGQPALDLQLGRLPKSAIVTTSSIFRWRRRCSRRRGSAAIRRVDGLGMLLHQACIAWQLWFGIDPDVTADLRATIEATLLHPDGPSAPFDRDNRLRPLPRFPARLVSAEGIDHTWLNLGHHECFARFTANRDFDVSELSFAKFTTQASRANADIVGLPVICSRLFRFSSFYVNRRAGFEPSRT